MDSDLQQAIALIKSGNENRGRQLLSEILKRDPNNVNAWLWLSSCVNTDEQRVYCLKKVLEINPHHEAARNALSKIELNSGQSLEKEVHISTPQPEKHKIDLQTKKKSPSASIINKNSSVKTIGLLLIAGITIGAICIVFLVGILFVIPNKSTANNSPQSQQISPSKQPTEQPLPTVTPLPTSTPQPVILPGPARRYVPVTNEWMPANYQYPIIDEYSLNDGDYYQIKFQALDGANILYEEPSYFFSAFVGNTIDDAIKKYRDTSQDFQVDKDDWKYEWSANTYPSSLFSESGQYVGYMGFFAESGRIFRVNNVVVLISVGIRNLNGIAISDINRIQQDLDKYTVIVDQNFP